MLRVQFEGAIYHVTLRGVERRDIFRDDRDRQRFLDRLAQDVETHGVRLYLFCLMTNHVHLLMETPRANLSRFMHDLETAHTVFFNRRHQRAGHLTQGRYGAKLVEGDEYLLRLSRYLHLNPVFVGSVTRLPLKERLAALRGYRWSSYRGYVGLAKPVEGVDYGPLLGVMPGKGARRRLGYRRFVEAGMAETDEEFIDALKESRLSLGTEAFRDWVQGLHIDRICRHKRKEDASFRRMERRLPVEEVFDVVSQETGAAVEAIRRRRRGTYLRPMAARMLVRYAGLTQREAAGELGLLTGAAVSIQATKLAQAAETDRRLREQLQRIEQRLETRRKELVERESTTAPAARPARARAGWRRIREGRRRPGRS
jgi:REP element-mobilizing transposase RayT